MRFDTGVSYIGYRVLVVFWLSFSLRGYVTIRIEEESWR